MAKRAALLLLVLAVACGGKSPRPPARRVSPPAPASAGPPTPSPQERTPATAPRDTTPAYSPALLASLAPTPRIRVGLSTTARGVRLTSSRPFRIGVGINEHLVETQEVLIEPLSSGMVEGATYRVQMQSFPTRARAEAFRSMLGEELDDALAIWREPRSGRFAVRLGAYPSEGGARVRLGEVARLGFDGADVVRDPTQTARPRGLLLRPTGQAEVQTTAMTLVVVPERAGAWVEVDGDPYRGYLEIFVNAANAFTIVNVVNLEDYLRGVVPAELSPKAFPEKEAIKAQAIAARTYAIKRRGQFESEGYDICDTPACQVYRGVSVEHPMASDAVRETNGEVLTYDGKLVDALYTSTCGGRTENAENIFSSRQPYLVSRACFLEVRGNVVRATSATPISLEAAALSTLGIAAPGTAATVSVGVVRTWFERAITHLGQTACWSSNDRDGDASVDIVVLAQLIGEGLCWEKRLPFLISTEDSARIVPARGLSERDRRHLAFAIQQDFIRPEPEGVVPGKPLDRRDVVATLYRVIVERGESPLRDGTVNRIESGRLYLTDDTLSDDDNEISTILAPERYLYRSAGTATYYASELVLLPGDAVRFHMSDDGIDVLELVSEGASFDRSSRLSHWVVRKTNEDLSREVNSNRPIGDIVELRPKRYGRSGRIVQLEIVGSSGSWQVDGLGVRRALGIRENLFFIDIQRGPDGTVDGWVFTGRGWGHGVGMCQVGAFGMAAAGYDYRQILSHYYTGTRVERQRPSAAHLHVDKRGASP